MLLTACIALSGCADATWANGLTGEPDESIGQNRAGIPRVNSNGAQWPNLATVPPRPEHVPPVSARQLQVEQLSQDRTDGEQLLQARNVPAATDNMTTPPVAAPHIGLVRAAPLTIMPPAP